MHVEGEDIDFIHRSFQEYFAAIFASRRSIEDVKLYLDFLLYDVTSMEFFHLLYDIDREEFERKYLIQKIKEIIDDVVSGKTATARAKRFFGHVIVVRYESEDVAEFDLVPIGFRIRKDEETCNYYALVQIVGRYYGIAPYSSRQHSSEGWQSSVVGNSIDKGGILILLAKDAPNELVEKGGLASYVDDVMARLLEIDRELDARHGRKMNYYRIP